MYQSNTLYALSLQNVTSQTYQIRKKRIFLPSSTALAITMANTLQWAQTALGPCWDYGCDRDCTAVRFGYHIHTLFHNLKTGKILVI